MKIAILILIILAAIVLAPLALIWAVGTLWDVQVEYDFWHWLAAFVFTALIAGSGASGRKS